MTPRRSRPARIALIVASAVAGVIACGLLLLGGLALWANGQKDSDGFFSTGSERFAADTRALASENLDIDLDGAESILDDEFGTIRLEVTPRGGEPVFVGIARTTQVSRYLRDVAHTTVTDVDYSPFSASYRRQDGERRPAPPARQPFWAVSANGPDAQTLSWHVKDGDWSIVVMNADGSAGVRAEIKAGAKVPVLDEIGWGAIAGGTVLLLAAAALLWLGIRSAPQPPQKGAHRSPPTPAEG